MNTNAHTGVLQKRCTSRIHFQLLRLLQRVLLIV